MKKIKGHIFISICLMLISISSYGFDACYEAEVYQIGFQALAKTRQDFVFDEAKSLSRKEVVNRILSAIEDHGHQPQNVSSKKTLAEEIYDVSMAFGVDPFIFAGLIEAESTFGADLLSGTGAAGYTQMTSAGLAEIRNQFKYRYAGGYLNATLKEGAYEYFQSLNPEDFIDWVTASGGVSVKGPLLKYEKKGVSYGLAAGAALLRTYLSVSRVLRPYNKYNYSPHGYAYALALYNGDKKKALTGNPTYLDYSRKVRKLSREIGFNQTCGEDLLKISENNTVRAISILDSVCKMSEKTCVDAVEKSFNSLDVVL